MTFSPPPMSANLCYLKSSPCEKCDSNCRSATRILKNSSQADFLTSNLISPLLIHSQTTLWLRVSYLKCLRTDPARLIQFSSVRASICSVIPQLPHNSSTRKSTLLTRTSTLLTASSPKFLLDFVLCKECQVTPQLRRMSSVVSLHTRPPYIEEVKKMALPRPCAFVELQHPRKYAGPHRRAYLALNITKIPSAGRLSCI